MFTCVGVQGRPEGLPEEPPRLPWALLLVQHPPDALGTVDSPWAEAYQEVDIMGLGSSSGAPVLQWAGPSFPAALWRMEEHCPLQTLGIPRSTDVHSVAPPPQSYC